MVGQVALVRRVICRGVEQRGEVICVRTEARCRGRGVEGLELGEQVEEGFVAWVVAVVPVEDPGVVVVGVGFVAVAEPVPFEAGVVVDPDDLV